MRTKWEPVPNEILEYFEQQARKSPEYYNGVVIHDAYKRKQDWKYVRERLLGHLTKEGRLEARRGFQSTTIVEVFMELNAPVALIDELFPIIRQEAIDREMKWTAIQMGCIYAGYRKVQEDEQQS